MNNRTNKNESLDFSPERRTKNIDLMKQEVFDVLVIGGGITGVGIARDAVLRGLKVALVEKDDFAAGTSSKSSKLVHGGFRYLKQGEFALVHEALVERKILMNIAPHLVHPTPCILPIYKNSAEPPWMIHIGLWLYDLLAFTKNIGRHRMLTLEEIAQMEPELRQEDLRKAAQYFDCKADDFRLVLATVQSAAQSGAVIANYVKAVEVLKEDHRVTGIVAKDQLTGATLKIRARAIANATGPWSDRVQQELFGEMKPHVRTTKGVHLLVHRDDLPIHHAFMQFSIQDGRPIFAIPWKNIVLLGTTDTDYTGDPDRIETEREDVDYILESFNYYFPRAHLTDDKVLSAFAGLRPLLREEGKSASQVTREHRIFETAPGFFSIVGGKLTTHRVMADDMVNRIASYLGKNFHIRPKLRKTVTATVPLYGGDIENFDLFYAHWREKLTRRHQFDSDIAEHFIETFGTKIPDLLEAIAQTPHGAERIHPKLPHVWGELTYALEHEMTLALDDFLIRRTHIFSLEKNQGLDVYPKILPVLSRRLEWTKKEEEKQVARLKMKVALTQEFRQKVRK